MRSFEERKEEIFSRSRARIAQRKKTVRRVLVTCVPLALCVTALSGYLVLGGFGGSDMSAPEAALEPDYNCSGADMPDAPQEEWPEGMPMQLCSVQVADQIYTDDQTMARIEELLPSYGMITDSDLEIPAESATGNKGNHGTAEAVTITLTYADGSTTTYTITDNCIAGPFGYRILTQEQLKWLESLY